MADWTQSMQQTFEYYKVDPLMWTDTEKIENVLSSKISFQDSTGSLSTAAIEVTDWVGECYIRIYLVTIQDGIRERHPLGVWLCQTPSIGYDGMASSIHLECYSPLIELKEKLLPLGYAVMAGENILDRVYALLKENMRAPVIQSFDTAVLDSPFIADPGDNPLTFCTDLLKCAGYILALDPIGRVYFRPITETAAMLPVYDFKDDECSILYSDIDVERDLYGIPNYVEVIKTNGAGYDRVVSVNDSVNSPVSTVNRGRIIAERIVDPETNLTLQAYADRYLQEASRLQCEIQFSHGYLPFVNLGSCVRLNYRRAGLQNVDVKIISQEMECSEGCKVTETGIMTIDLIGGM